MCSRSLPCSGFLAAILFYIFSHVSSALKTKHDKTKQNKTEKHRQDFCISHVIALYLNIHKLSYFF